MISRSKRWWVTFLLPACLIFSVAACQRAGDDAGVGSSSGASTDGQSESGGMGADSDSESYGSSGMGSDEAVEGGSNRPESPPGGSSQ